MLKYDHARSSSQIKQKKNIYSFTTQQSSIDFWSSRHWSWGITIVTSRNGIDAKDCEGA
jgi:hypothetical protein